MAYCITNSIKDHQYNFFKMNRNFIICLLLALPIYMIAQKPAATKQKLATKVKLPNGWDLSPAGRSLPLGDLPLNIAVSSSKN